MTQKNINLLVNIILFQASWFVLVMGCLWLAMIPVSVLIFHAILISNNAKADIVFALWVVFYGVLSDTLLMSFNVYSLPDGFKLFEAFLPVWLILLWLVFAFSLQRSLSWLFDFPKLMVLILCVAGPVSYYAGSQLNPSRIVINESLILFVFIQWSVLAMVMLGLNNAVFSRMLNKSK